MRCGNDEEVVADELARATDDLDGEAHPLLGGAAPVVGTVVGAAGEELVDQVALGAHDLHSVVARLPREGRPGWRSRSRCGRPRGATGRAA